jgi:hypothetical protein
MGTTTVRTSTPVHPPARSIQSEKNKKSVTPNHGDYTDRVHIYICAVYNKLRSTSLTKLRLPVLWMKLGD